MALVRLLIATVRSNWSPVIVLPARAALAVPSSRAALIWAAEAAGNMVANRPAAPVTWGAAIEVPLKVP